MKNKYVSRTLMAMGIIILIALSFVAAYYLIGYVFEKIGRPPALVAYLLTCILGFVGSFIIMHIIRFFFFWIQGNEHDKRRNEMLDAMAKISQGDFKVFISKKHDNRYHELAEGFNDMAQKLGSLENLRQDFISNVSHEIQSPLTSISGFAALLKSETLSPEQKNHYLYVIETESKRLSKLSDNLLKLSTLESDSTVTIAHKFSLDKQIESSVLMLEPQWAEKNIDFDLSLAKFMFVGDEELLAQVWVNLLHNSIKFTPVNGRISITLTENENMVCCSISDNGIGISLNDQIHIFERFYKVDKSRDRSLGGNGLGLSLVKKIIDMHGGQINVKSELGKGTEFIITLPINQKQQQEKDENK